MNWDDVRIFLAVARAGQILGAARRLELNHATVSRRVAALEEALGAKLFRRLTTGSELTPAGERFLDVAERMEADMIAARSELAGDGEAVSGTVRIGAPDGFGVAFLAPRLGALTDAAPRTDDPARAGAALLLAVAARGRHRHHRRAAGRGAAGGGKAGRLFARPLRLARLRRGARPARKRRPSSPAHRLVGYVPDLVVSPSLDYAAEFSADWDARFAISSALGQVEAVRSGAGIGILHAFIARAMPELVPVDGVPPIRRAYWLVYHESVRPLRRIQAVAGFIATAVEEARSLFVLICQTYRPMPSSRNVDVGLPAADQVGEHPARAAGHGPAQRAVAGVEPQVREPGGPMIGGPSGVIGLSPHQKAAWSRSAPSGNRSPTEWVSVSRRASNSRRS